MIVEGGAAKASVDAIRNTIEIFKKLELSLEYYLELMGKRLGNRIF
jgi:hypothetical protein